MLQFLQYKTFGTHRVPDGWIIVVAGNPPEYNRSVRDFDITTLDRLKRIDVAADYTVWREYAYSHSIHPVILSYLDIRKDHFYQVETVIGGEQFVTARGWEDLSRYLYACEKLELPVTLAATHQYIQHEEIARDFRNYYELFNKYRQHYNITAILRGVSPDETTPEGKEILTALAHLNNAGFDEAVSVIGLLLGQLTESFSELHQTDETLSLVHTYLQHFRGSLASSKRIPMNFYGSNMNAWTRHSAPNGLPASSQRNVNALSLQHCHSYLPSIRHLPVITVTTGTWLLNW